MKRWAGFTVIEVMVVLAIAGLIMVAVFLSIPALQRNQRNEQRKRDLRAIHAALIEYYNDNGFRLPRTNTYGEANGGDWDYSCPGQTRGGTDFMTFLNLYMSNNDVPVDPINNCVGDGDGYYYRYYCYNWGPPSNTYGVELSTMLETGNGGRQFYIALTAKRPDNTESVNFRCN